MSYSTAVASACGVIRNEPSPTTATQGRSGAASLAPRMPEVANPIAAKPQEWIRWRGRSASNNWMIQLWCTPTSLAMIALSGSARDSARISRSGRSGIWSEVASPPW